MSQIETTTAVATIALIKKPATVADFKNNAEFYHAAALKAQTVYNEALTQYQRAVELDGVAAGVVVVFNQGAGEKAETLSGTVLARLEDGKYQILVQYVGQPAKLLNVKPQDLVSIQKPQVEEVVEQPAPTPEYDAQ